MSKNKTIKARGLACVTLCVCVFVSCNSTEQAYADFYRPVYPETRSILAGDPRLGELRERLGGIELRWAILGRMGWADSLIAVGGHELSILNYRQLHSSVRAQVFSLALTWGY